MTNGIKKTMTLRTLCFSSLYALSLLSLGFAPSAFAADLYMPQPPQTEAPPPPPDPNEELSDHLYEKTKEVKEANVIETLQVPAVYIGGKRVKLVDEVEKAENLTAEHQIAPPKKEKHREFKLFTHTPLEGPRNAPIELVEFTDLSCLQCQPLMRIADDLMKKHPGQIKLYHVYLPVDLYNITNPATFYSRLARDKGVFWNYRKALYNIKEVSANAFVQALMDSGVKVEDVRNLSIHNARKYYREMDADSELAKTLGETKPPVLYVNGLRITPDTPKEHIDILVEQTLEFYKEANPESVIPSNEEVYGKL